MSAKRPDLSRTLRSVGWLSAQTVLMGAATPVMENHCPWANCQTRTGATDEAGRIGVSFEDVVDKDAGFVLVGAVIARAGGDGAKTFDGGDEGEAALFRVVLVEDEGVDLPARGSLPRG